MAQVERFCPQVSRELIRKTLRNYRNQGLLVTTNKGRGAAWQKVGNRNSQVGKK
jgi:hypothetical protein